MNGFINLLKPIGPTSFQAVGRIKHITGEKKAGHTGTLDPGAAGVLPICLGKATKLSALLTETKKVYKAEITFGVITDTQDSYGRVLKTKKAAVSREEIEALLQEFRGTQQQIPPMYSAVKKDGRKLYQLARMGIEVERKPRSIEIYKIELKDYFPPDRAIIHIECSKGTYIRTLCHDIGAMSGFGAIMSCLVRLYAGGFSLESAVTIEELEAHAGMGDIRSLVLPLDYPLQDIPKVTVKDNSFKFAINGNMLFEHNIESGMEGFDSGQILRVYCRDSIIGIGVFESGGQAPCISIKTLLTGAKSPDGLNKQV